MSNKFKLLTLAFLSVSMMFFFGCSDDDNGNGTGPLNGDYYMTADLSGDLNGSFEALSAACIYNANTIVGAEGNNENSTNISINSLAADLSTAEGEMDISPENLLVNFSYFDNGDSKVFTAVSGKVNITSNTDNSITGTFEFEATNQDGTEKISVTNGEFRVRKY